MFRDQPDKAPCNHINKGHEATSFLQYMVSHYASLPPHVFF
eukprot:gene20345-4857_t